MKFNRLPIPIIFLVLFLVSAGMKPARAQSNEELSKQIEALQRQISNMQFSFQAIDKQTDDLLWYERIGDIAFIDKIKITGPPLSKQQTKNPTGQGAGNPLVIYSYIFLPKDYDPSKKYPLMVFVHGGIHGSVLTMGGASGGGFHIMRELVSQGYIVVAPEYRGSAGYGAGFHRAIDYGGLEIEDVYAARNYMVENYSFVDKNNIGIMGWSHGGMQTLMNIFDHPEAYKAAYAGVPVSDVVARMGYKSQGYRDLFEADYHIGKSAADDVKEYMRRSPAWNAEKLQTPLLIHTNTNDEDVNVLEVQHLIKSLVFEGKQKLFEYKIYEDQPGGHVFNQLDSKAARESRVEIYKFMAKHLNPAKPISNLNQLTQVSYIW